MDIVIGLVLLISICVISIWYFKPYRKYAPGPIGLPLFGNVFQMPTDVSIYKILTKWAEKYGPIFAINIGPIYTIVLNDPQMVRDAFNHPALNGRPTNKVFRSVSGGDYGIIGVDGTGWSEQRRFTIRHLKNFGFGKNQMERLILDEAKELVDNFKSENGKPFDPTKRFSLAVLNSLWIIVTGSRFSQDDDRVQKIVEEYFKGLDEVFVTGILSIFPVLAEIAPEWSGFNRFLKTIQRTSSFFRSIVEEHEKSFVENSSRDYIDEYLQEMRMADHMPDSSFYKENGMKNLLAIIGDLFAAGAETTSTTLNWSVLYLAMYPDVQIKLQEEIDRIIGERLPNLADRSNMPFTEALMYEVMRKSSIASVGLLHRATEDVTFYGYHIPKNTWVLPHFHRIHHNPEYWSKPNEFMPERFLIQDTNGAFKVQRNENLMPFSSGKRVCIGRDLAKDEFFLFLTSIFQRFNIELDPDDENITLEPQVTFIDRPKPYRVIMKDRRLHI